MAEFEHPVEIPHSTWHLRGILFIRHSPHSTEFCSCFMHKRKCSVRHRFCFYILKRNVVAENIQTYSSFTKVRARENFPLPSWIWLCHCRFQPIRNLFLGSKQSFSSQPRIKLISTHQFIHQYCYYYSKRTRMRYFPLSESILAHAFQAVSVSQLQLKS